MDIFSACLLCGACSAICPRHIDISKELVIARNSFAAVSGPHAYKKYLARKLLDYPESLAGLRVLGKTGEKLIAARLPENSGLRLRLAMFQENIAPPPVTVKDRPFAKSSENRKTISWFPGCTARYLFPDILASCRSLFAGATIGLTAPGALACCGLADWAAGDIQGARKKGRRNIKTLEKTTGEILVSCASCFAQLKNYPKLFDGEGDWQQRADDIASRLVEFSAYLENQKLIAPVAQEKENKKTRLFYHVPCHLRHDKEAVDMAREQLQKTGRVEILMLEDGDRCCGQGGLFHVAHPEISARIRDQLVQDVLRLQPDIISSTCSGCLIQWQQGITAAGSGVKVLHLAQVLEGLS